MQLEIRQVNSSDKALWNAYVESHPQASAYHAFAWVESVEQAYGHPNASLIALKDKQVVGVLPISKMLKPFVGHSFCSLPFCDIGYALSDNDETTSVLLEHLQKLKTDTGAKKIEYRDSEHIDSQQKVDTTDLKGKKVRMLLSLPDTSDILLKSFKSKLRSQIRKAEKNGLTYQIGNSTELLNAFYQVFKYNMRKLGSPVHGFDWFKTLQKNYQENFILSVVYYENTPVGGGIVLRNGVKTCIPWASTLAEYNRLAPNMMLYWSLLKEVSDSGAKEFDFGRSTFGEGTFKFKEQWGAQPVALNWELPGQQTTQATNQTGPGNLRSLVEKSWSKLPIGVTTTLGPKIRKYISL